MGVERALVHEELMRLDRVRHTFVSMASHELRTPTAAVLGAALTLAGRELTPDQDSQLKRVLADQAQRLADLLEQLLDLSRLEAQAVEIRPIRVRLRDRIEAIVATVAPGRNDEIEIDAPPDLVVEADPVAIERVVANLVVNALRHGKPPILISAMQNDRHLRLMVEDRGDGVPDDVRSRLFEQFVRSASAAGTQGTGLGLAIAKSYAQAHGGDVIFDSGFRDGARFQLVLPVARPSL
jgi:signal transduction histidine kinase